MILIPPCRNTREDFKRKYVKDQINSALKSALLKVNIIYIFIIILLVFYISYISITQLDMWEQIKNERFVIERKKQIINDNIELFILVNIIKKSKI